MQKCSDYASCGNNQTLEIAVNSNPIAVIITCHNEALTIAKVVDDFHRELPEATAYVYVYVYDNNSTDTTAQIAREHGAIVKFEPRQGKATSAVICSATSRPIVILWLIETVQPGQSTKSIQ